MTNTPLKRSNRLDWLDAIRGLAAVQVMLFHYVRWAVLPLLGVTATAVAEVPHETISAALHRAFADNGFLHALYDLTYLHFDLGKMGVIVFFLVSGFVVPYSLSGNQHPVIRFLVSRVFRLYPVYWISIVLIVLLQPWGGHSLVTTMVNLTMFQGFLRMADINPVAWTLQIEWVFYLVCLGLFCLRGLHTLKGNLAMVAVWSVVALGLATLRFALGGKAPVAIGLGLTYMFFGFVWRKFILQEVALSAKAMGALTLGLLAVTLATCALGYTEAPLRYAGVYVAALAIFMALTTFGRLTQPFFVFLGQISYSLYLFHAVVGYFVIPGLMELCPQMFLSDPPLVLLPMGIASLVSLGVATLAYRYIEVPSMGWGKQAFKALVILLDQGLVVRLGIPSRLNGLFQRKLWGPVQKRLGFLGIGH